MALNCLPFVYFQYIHATLHFRAQETQSLSPDGVCTLAPAWLGMRLTVELLLGILTDKLQKLFITVRLVFLNDFLYSVVMV